MYRRVFHLPGAFLVALSLIGAYNPKYFIVKLYAMCLVRYRSKPSRVSKPLNSEKGVPSLNRTPGEL